MPCLAEAAIEVLHVNTATTPGRRRASVVSRGDGCLGQLATDERQRARQHDVSVAVRSAVLLAGNRATDKMGGGAGRRTLVLEGGRHQFASLIGLEYHQQ